MQLSQLETVFLKSPMLLVMDWRSQRVMGGGAIAAGEGGGYCSVRET